MKVLIQRVSRGSVSVDGEVLSRIGPGLVVLAGVRQGDTEAEAAYLAERTVNLRIFPDDEGKMNLSVRDIGGEILVISQFTLYADTRKGNRPSFVRAAEPELAEVIYDRYAAALKQILGAGRVFTGVFRAMMSVEIINDGPVTVELTSDR